MEAMSKKSITTLDRNARKSIRQSVLLGAVIEAGDYEFNCKAYNLSLGGVRLKLNLPLALNSMVKTSVKGSDFLQAQVVWVDKGFIGLSFAHSPAEVAKCLGELGARLPKS
ncbi:PilZ domain-containing protein [Paremcibacter congregatus]|uniref:PilZ domain-containing protein n=1 Tax=Paremcibacter congregatus TaxID=2043170 RepID=UPI0030EB80F2|tara:strand:- start:1195 stop:1527 length:333 start_codon:yes stop_codon:yes gene_type:complete